MFVASAMDRQCESAAMGGERWLQGNAMALSLSFKTCNRRGKFASKRRCEVSRPAGELGSSTKLGETGETAKTWAGEIQANSQQAW